MAHVDYSYLCNSQKFREMIDKCNLLKIGDKIKFETEKQRYTVKAKSDRFLICTKPFNPKKTCLYTIIDLDRLVRGTNDRIFNPYDYMIQEDIDECMEDLISGKVEATHRNCILLDVE